MIASRTPVSLHSLLVAGRHRRRCGGGGRKRGLVQRRHLTQALESLWRHTPRPAPPAAVVARGEANPSWRQPPPLENPAFEEYYKEQQIVREEEWDDFISLLRKPLPATFRINARYVLKVSDEYGKDAIRPLPWYPGNLAWHLNFSRKQLRKNQALESFHEFLKHESEVGHITRQEAVSMVPPLFLDIQPDHHILDTPGSKTFQLLEMIHQSKEPGLLPKALVVANDVNAQRCDVLIHNTKRMCTANLIVTNHGAQNFPDCCLANDLSEIYRNDCKPQRLEFDRVLCDVPCSGDGTIRKGHDMWRKWNSDMGNGLHVLQVDISMRGIALLKVGGRMVYSTCSMNPVENEAVIAELLRRSGNSIELLDVSNELPELVRRPGLGTWKVKDKGSWFQNHEDVPDDRKNVIVPSMFPSSESTQEKPSLSGKANTDSNRSLSRNFSTEKTSKVCSDTDGVSNSNSTKHSDSTSNSMGSNFPLHRCMRIVPHDQDSGAFFIAVLHKLSPLNEGQMAKVTKTDHLFSTDRAVNFNEELHSETVRPGKTVVHQQKIGFEVLDDELLQEQKNLSMDDHTSKDKNLTEVSLVSVDVNDQAESENGMKLPDQCKWKGVDPILLFKDLTVIKSIVSFFGINISFPLEGHLVTRSADPDNARRIYYVSKSVQEILQLNVAVGEQLKITSLGLKMFETHRSKDGCPCAYRLSYEALPLLLPYISKRILRASPNDFLRLLQYRTVNFAHFIDARFGEEASSLIPGCCIVILHEDLHNLDLDSITMDPTTIAIVCWRGRATLNAMVSPPDRKELLERITHRFGLKAFRVEEDENPEQKIN
uniref:SAM-dependent MTase RsmB/NOP-type domain-containing protein n=1 Tax=Leersia perrieri TaxID=77586 RepID=A0A0D9X927_9ORYZ